MRQDHAEPLPEGHVWHRSEGLRRAKLQQDSGGELEIMVADVEQSDPRL